MRITGNIPIKVTYFPKMTTFVGFEWDDDEDAKLNHKMPVRAAYCSDSANKKTLETGSNWRSHEGGEYVEGKGWTAHAPATDIIERDNSPIDNIRVISLEVRSEGGRAYKVVTPDGFYFDLREDVLLDTMLNNKIEQGVLGGSYVWAKVGSQMKLVRVGSELHEALIEADARHRNAPLSKTSFVIGQCYRNKKGDNRMFLGEFATLEVQVEEEKDQYNRNIYDHSIGDYRYVHQGVKQHKKVQVWLEVPDYYVKPHDGPAVTDFDSLLKAFISEGSRYGRKEPDSEMLSYHLAFVKEAKVTDADPFKIELPSDYITKIQDFIRKYWRMERRSNKETGKPSLYDRGYYSKTFHLVPVGTTPVLLPEFEK